MDGRLLSDEGDLSLLDEDVATAPRNSSSSQDSLMNPTGLSAFTTRSSFQAAADATDLEACMATREFDAAMVRMTMVDDMKSALPESAFLQVSHR